MVIYDIQCKNSHVFEAWFPSLEAFEDQLRRCLVTCAVCGVTDVKKLPTGAHLGGRSKSIKDHVAPAQNQSSALSPKSGEKAVNYDPVIFMKTVNRFVESHFKNVGDQFADQAIEMQRGRKPKEAIYGRASEEDYGRLKEEGVEFSLIPKLPEEFEN